MAQRPRLRSLLLPGIAIVAIAALAPTCASRPLPGSDSSDTAMTTSATPYARARHRQHRPGDIGIAAAPTHRASRSPATRPS